MTCSYDPISSPVTIDDSNVCPTWLSLPNRLKCLINSGQDSGTLSCYSITIISLPKGSQDTKPTLSYILAITGSWEDRVFHSDPGCSEINVFTLNTGKQIIQLSKVSFVTCPTGPSGLRCWFRVRFSRAFNVHLRKENETQCRESPSRREGTPYVLNNIGPTCFCKETHVLKTQEGSLASLWRRLLN